jgi:hypothetical protein
LLFVAPAMLAHCVEVHRYRPPEVFVTVLMASPSRERRNTAPLSSHSVNGMMSYGSLGGLSLREAAERPKRRSDEW